MTPVPGWSSDRKVVAFATQGLASSDAVRLAELLDGCSPVWCEIDRSSIWRRAKSAFRLLVTLRRNRSQIAVMEGTGFAGGLPLMVAEGLWGQRYVVDTGDAVAPYIRAHYGRIGWIAARYERRLLRRSIGVVGWSPYLVGRALTYGAPSGVTVPGWAGDPVSPEERVAQRANIRKVLGIPADALVIGIVGSLVWNRFPRTTDVSTGYCYGWDLLKAASMSTRPNLFVLIVGDGSGLVRLRELANRTGVKSVLFTGQVERNQVADYLAAMDIGCLPQSRDGVGNFRYTTKITEYVASRLPFVTNEIVASYDLDTDGFWRLPGRSPWDDQYLKAFARLLDSVHPEEVLAKSESLSALDSMFAKSSQLRRFRRWFVDIDSASGR